MDGSNPFHRLAMQRARLIEKVGACVFTWSSKVMESDHPKHTCSDKPKGHTVNHRCGCGVVWKRRAKLGVGRP